MLNFLPHSIRSTKGASLIVTLGLVLVLALLAGGVATMVGAFTQLTGQSARANIAYFAAEGGIEQALYDLTAYKDGYVANPTQNICGPAPETVDIFDLNLKYNNLCTGANIYRLTDFSDSTISAEERRSFWQVFSRTLQDQLINKYTIPNPFFTTNSNPVASKDGILQESEWGRLTKSRPLSFSLMIDGGDPGLTDPAQRFTYLPFDTTTKKIIFFIDPAETWTPANYTAGMPPHGRSYSQEDVFSWTLSAIDGNSDEYTLQGVVWESDFQTCDVAGYATGGSYTCFVLDLTDTNISNGPLNLGHPLAGEDINKNLLYSVEVPNGFNRVAAITENYKRATMPDYLKEMNERLVGTYSVNDRWRDVRLTINLIGTLSETSGLASDSLRYKMLSAKELADEYVYIVSEGFAGTVKQTIETRFRRQATIPIFQYVIVQH